MSTQFAPAASQRCHFSVSSGNGVPDQLPVTALRLFPTAAGSPEIDGLTVFVGLSLRIAPVGAESAELFPTEVVAVTWARGAGVASSPTSRYVEFVAPAMFPQLAPFVSQRRHW